MSTIDGLTATRCTPIPDAFAAIEQPDRPEQVAELLQDASSSGRVIVPVGGGGALSLGNPTDPDAVGLSLRRLNQVLDYQPTDMTLSVSAGATLAEIDQVIGANGQALPIEPVDPATATIGGLLATALSGPRRYGGGTLRDVLIGISVAYPDGTIGKGGGLVVKNVSGYDMMRMHYGALGTLGVILSANFKVLPAIRNEFTATWKTNDLEAAGQLVSALRHPAVRPSALIARSGVTGWSVGARFEGRPGGLDAVRSKLKDIPGESTILVNEESAAYWQGVMADRALRPETVRLRAGTLPTETIETARILSELVPDSSRTIEVEPGVGLSYATWSPGDAVTTIEVINAIRARLDRANCTIMAAPDAIKNSLDVWGEEPSSIAIMRRLKQEFDPASVLNRYRLVGHI